MSCNVRPNFLADLLKNQKFLIVDGSFSTGLEEVGYDVQSKPHWTASANVDAIELVRMVYERFIEAGCNILTTNTYHHPIAKNKEGTKFIKPITSFKIAVLGSIGPYAVLLRDGSEYAPHYAKGNDNFVHIDRYFQCQIQALSEMAVDGLLFETIPSWLEANIIRMSMQSRPNIPFVISFNLAAEDVSPEGHSVIDVIMETDLLDLPNLLAIGFNCSDAQATLNTVKKLSQVFRKRKNTKAIFAYPNSGEKYADQRFVGDVTYTVDLAEKLFEAGAAAVGACCRLGPTFIHQLHQLTETLKEKESKQEEA